MSSPIFRSSSSPKQGQASTATCGDRLIIDPKIAQRFNAYATFAYPYEIGGLLHVVELDNGDFLVDDIKIFKQKVTGAYFEVDSMEMMKFVMGLELDGKGADIPLWRSIIHSHPSMTPQMSGTDRDQIEQLAGNKYAFSVICSAQPNPAKNYYAAHYCQAGPVQLLVHNMPVLSSSNKTKDLSGCDLLTQEEIDEIRAEVESLCEAMPVTSKKVLIMPSGLAVEAADDDDTEDDGEATVVDVFDSATLNDDEYALIDEALLEMMKDEQSGYDNQEITDTQKRLSDREWLCIEEMLLVCDALTDAKTNEVFAANLTDLVTLSDRLEDQAKELMEEATAPSSDEEAGQKVNFPSITADHGNGSGGWEFAGGSNWGGGWSNGPEFTSGSDWDDSWGNDGWGDGWGEVSSAKSLDDLMASYDPNARAVAPSAGFTKAIDSPELAVAAVDALNHAQKDCSEHDSQQMEAIKVKIAEKDTLTKDDKQMLLACLYTRNGTIESGDAHKKGIEKLMHRLEQSILFGKAPKAVSANKPVAQSKVASTANKPNASSLVALSTERDATNVLCVLESCIQQCEDEEKQIAIGNVHSRLVKSRFGLTYEEKKLILACLYDVMTGVVTDCAIDAKIVSALANGFEQNLIRTRPAASLTQPTKAIIKAASQEHDTDIAIEKDLSKQLLEVMALQGVAASAEVDVQATVQALRAGSISVEQAQWLEMLVDTVWDACNAGNDTDKHDQLNTLTALSGTLDTLIRNASSEQTPAGNA